MPDQWLPGDGVEGGEGEKKTTKYHSETFRGDEFVYGLDYGGTFMGVYLCQSLSNCSL